MNLPVILFYYQPLAGDQPSAISYSLRSLLIRIDIRLYLQIVEQIKIRVQIFVLIERLQVAHGRSHYRHRRRTSFAGEF